MSLVWKQGVGTDSYLCMTRRFVSSKFNIYSCLVYESDGICRYPNPSDFSTMTFFFFYTVILICIDIFNHQIIFIIGNLPFQIDC